MRFHIFLYVHRRPWLHGIELEVLLEPGLNLRTELLAYLSFPIPLLATIVLGIQGQHKQKINIIMEQQQRVTVIQTVVKLLRHIAVALAVGLFYAVVAIIKLPVHRCRDKEIWNDIISFCLVITQLHA